MRQQRRQTEIMQVKTPATNVFVIHSPTLSVITLFENVLSNEQTCTNCVWKAQYIECIYLDQILSVQTV